MSARPDIHTFITRVLKSPLSVPGYALPTVWSPQFVQCSGQLLVLIMVQVGVSVQCGLHGLMPQAFRYLQGVKAYLYEHTGMAVVELVEASVNNKDIPLSEIVDYIDKIVVDSDKQIVVQ